MMGFQRRPAIRLFPLAAGIVLCWGSTRAATIDATTQGSWIGAYGSDGYILCDFAEAANGQLRAPADKAYDVASLPPYITGYTYSPNAFQYMWQTQESALRGLQNPAAPDSWRKSATIAADTSFYIDFVASQPGMFELAVYALDYDSYGGGRSIILNVPGDSAALSSFQDGTWAVFDIYLPAPQSFRLDIIDNQPTGGNNTISAILFAGFTPIPEPSAATVLLTLGLFRLWRGGRRRAGQRG